MATHTPTPPGTHRGGAATGYPAAISIPSGNRRAVERALTAMAKELDRPQFVVTDAGRHALGAMA